MTVTRAVSHGREPVCQGPVTHGGAGEEPNSAACLYSKDSPARVRAVTRRRVHAAVPDLRAALPSAPPQTLPAPPALHGAAAPCGARPEGGAGPLRATRVMSARTRSAERAPATPSPPRSAARRGPDAGGRGGSDVPRKVRVSRKGSRGAGPVPEGRACRTGGSTARRRARATSACTAPASPPARTPRDMSPPVPPGPQARRPAAEPATPGRRRRSRRWTWWS